MYFFVSLVVDVVVVSVSDLGFVVSSEAAAAAGGGAVSVLVDS
jgi:hypothetical protein